MAGQTINMKVGERWIDAVVIKDAGDVDITDRCSLTVSNSANNVVRFDGKRTDGLHFTAIAAGTSTEQVRASTSGGHIDLVANTLSVTEAVPATGTETFTKVT